MTTTIKSTRTEDTQKVATFTGEGAYHGSGKYREKAIPEFENLEIRPTTLIDGGDPFREFQATFDNNYRIVEQLEVPSQEEIRQDGITFVWSFFDEALETAGPLTKSVLLAMRPHLGKHKKFIYVDSKIQYFKKGDIAVDSKLWHVDGSITCRDSRATQHGFPLLHDMMARDGCAILPPRYLAYQSSTHVATQWVDGEMKLKMPACIPTFDSFAELVDKKKPKISSQPAASIIQFTGYDIHRAIPAEDDGWRLWIRVSETNREIKVDESAVNCYGSVFRING